MSVRSCFLEPAEAESAEIMRLRARWLGLIVFFAFASPASALRIIDPDAFADGTDISTAFPGITLS